MFAVDMCVGVLNNLIIWISFNNVFARQTVNVGVGIKECLFQTSGAFHFQVYF